MSRRMSQYGRANFLVLLSACIAAVFLWIAVRARTASAAPQDASTNSSRPVSGLLGQSQEEAQRKSAGCVSCHTATDEPTMHPTKTVQLACTDCHGGDSSAIVASGVATSSIAYNAIKEKAHVHPKNLALKNRAAVPERVFTAWLNESYEYIKFVNPGDLRVAPETCGSSGCHPSASWPEPWASVSAPSRGHTRKPTGAA